jgi:hypothetical protein
MVHQKNKIESKIRSSADSESKFVLTVTKIIGDLAENQRKSGEAETLRLCFGRGDCSALRMIGNAHFPELGGSALWDNLMKWVGTRVAEKPGEEDREYVFGRMVS